MRNGNAKRALLNISTIIGTNSIMNETWHILTLMRKIIRSGKTKRALTYISAINGTNGMGENGGVRKMTY